ncbi:hypothetical protein QTP88_005604 [Uroleucon formosanum]
MILRSADTPVPLHSPCTTPPQSNNRYSYPKLNDPNGVLIDFGGPEKGRFKLCLLVRAAKLSLLLGLLGQEHGLDVGQHTTLSDCYSGQQFVQLLVIPDGQLQMSGDDTRLLVVTGGVTCQFQNFSCQVLHYGGQIHRCSGSDTFGVVSFSQQTVDTTDRELESGPGRPGLGFASLRFSCFAASAHDYYSARTQRFNLQQVYFNYSTMAPGGKSAGKAMKKSSGKAQKNIAKSDKKRKPKRKESYAIYIYKVLKQVHPDTGVSSKAMSIMNSFVNDLFERIAAESSRLAHYNKRSTITSREIQTAVRLLLPGELAKHAVSEGTKAVTKTDLPSVRGSPAHGGTAVLVNRRIVHHHTSLRTDLQSTSVIIKLQDTEILITAVYKPLNQILVPIDLDTLTQTSDWSISAGDLNSKHPLWHSRTTNTAGSTLYNHVQRSDYAVMAPSTPTYHPYNNSFRPDVLDIALIKIPMSVEITNINDLSSDHNPILLEVHSTPIASYPPSAKRFINWRKYADLLAKQVTDMNPCTTALYDIDQAIEKFSTTIHAAIGQNSSAMKPRRATMVLPSFIIDEIKAKNRLRREWQTSRDPETKRRLNAKQHFIRAVLSTHKKDKWDKFLESLDTQDGSIYKINKTLLHKRPATHPLSGPNGLVFSATDKAELIADSLAQQFTLNPGPELPEVTNFIRRFTNAAPSSTLHTSPNFVADILSKLPKNRAPGEDLITNTALRLLPRNMILALTKILNGCLRLCYFPTAWKRATIISIPKPGKDPLRPDSYRPIALLSSISKIYEKIILLRFQKHISDQIRPEQSAFRSEHSTAQQLVKLVERISNNLNNRIQTASVFLDVEKAFDRVWHDGLLYKMSTLKIPQNLIKLTQSFLSNRSFRVRIEDKLSSLRDIQAGVPQGSCLAPTLYLIFTNDIPVNNKASVALFADDTMYLTSNHNANIAIIQLQRQLQQTSVWFKKWRLRINASKTIAILFSRKRTNNLPQISINDTLIPWSTHVMYHGVTFGRTLNFGMHIKNTVRKATRTRGILYPILNRNSPVPTRARINIFKLYINPIMTYAGAA